MHHKRFHPAAWALLALVSCGSSWAQEAPKPADQPAPQFTVSKAARAQPPVTEANADQVVQDAVEAAKKGYLDSYFRGPERNAATLLEERLKDYPHVTLKRLAPYVADPDDKVRLLVQSVADRVLDDSEVPETHAEALSLLVQIAGAPVEQDAKKPFNGFSATMAVRNLHSWLFEDLQKTTRDEMRQKVDMAALKAALVTYLNRTVTEEGVALLSLFASDTTLKPFVDKIAVRDDYSIYSLLLQSAWGSGSAIDALKQRIELNAPGHLQYLVQNILALNEPNVLRALWKQLDNKTKLEGEEYLTGMINKPQQVYPRVCDFVLAAFRLKFDDYPGKPGMWPDVEHPPIATDDELAKAKARFHAIIAALPQIGEQVGNAFEPF